MRKTVFSPADILLPPYAPFDERWNAYSVIACDQFTSEPEYWERAEAVANNNLSTLDLILPEAYLDTVKEENQKSVVAESMKTVACKLALHESCFVYIERTLPDGRVRPGIVGKIDLEAYDFSPDSKSFVRATEETVISRIPPRVAVRREATVELPHVMVFANDRQKLLLAPLADRKNEMELLYSFELMLGGGSIKGYKIAGELLSDVWKAVESYESLSEDGLVYAMGDGNHSLASAKAHYESIKAEKGAEFADKLARYALVEIVDIYDDSIEFEPIYRLLINCDYTDFCSYVDSKMNESDEKKSVRVIVGGEEHVLEIPSLHALQVGSLQMLIDSYIKSHDGVACDYIHGTESLKKLSAREGCVGFLCEGIEKDELFSYVAKFGNLPRKTFSMGEAASKRYYLEARKIK